MLSGEGAQESFSFASWLSESLRFVLQALLLTAIGPGEKITLFGSEPWVLSDTDGF